MDSGLHAQFPTSDPDPGIEAKAEPDPPPPSSCNVESTLGGGVEKACTVCSACRIRRRWILYV